MSKGDLRMADRVQHPDSPMANTPAGSAKETAGVLLGGVTRLRSRAL